MLYLKYFIAFWNNSPGDSTKLRMHVFPVHFVGNKYHQMEVLPQIRAD